MNTSKKFSETNLVAMFGAESFDWLLRLQDISADEPNRLVNNAIDGLRIAMP